MDKNNTNNQLALNRVRWACRRGMLELDVVLMRYVDEAYETLEDEDKQRFMQLLSCQDPDLFSWLMGNEMPPDADLQIIVSKIRNHVRKQL